jgi:predicted molibdopterin-dependent oxidoreductase YjgC
MKEISKQSASPRGRLVRLQETGRAVVRLSIDSLPTEALEGDTVLVAMLTNVRTLRQSEFGDDRRAGFCMMGACQDCWVWDAGGARLRACSTVVEAGMQLFTRQPEATWPQLA